MKILAKNKKLIFSIIAALIVFLMAIFAFTFKNNNFEVYADYGELKEEGYYSKDDVIFYAIKVKDGKLLWKADAKIKFTYESGENPVTFDPVNDNTETKENYVNLYKKTDGTIVYKVGGIEKTVTKFLDPNKEETEISSSSINFIGILADDLLQPVKYNDTVLLEDGEQILISFGNTTEEYDFPASDPIDFSNVKIIVNGNEDLIDDLQIESTHGETSTKQSLTYVYDLTKISGTTLINPEGLVEFSADYEHKTANNKFDFKFYVFHKDTYKATQPNGEVRPNASLQNVSTVYDQDTRNTFFSESFYYFNNQDWTKIVYNPERYELNISKNVNTFASTYTFTYNNGRIVEEVEKPRTTEDIYVSDFYWETNADGGAKLDSNGNATLYLKDIGVYDITYKAVYYSENGSKAELDSLNTDERTDRLTIYGVQATYNDFEDGQTELREIKNPTESISADVTGKFSFNPTATAGDKYKINTIDLLANKIASTNQPQVRFITNSTEQGFEVYYAENFSSNENFEVTKETGYTINSNFTKPGYYFVIVKNAYEKFKNDSGIQSNVERTQYFVFRIKNQSPSISIYKLAEENNNLVYSNTIMSGSFEGGNYVGSFVNKGVLIEQYEENSSFDLPIEFKLERKGFAENDFSEISLGTATTLNNSDETAQKTGYKITEDGHYRLVVNFGSSNIKRYFDIDSQPISGVQTKDVNQVGTNTFAIAGNAQQANANTLLTSSSFVLNWLDKASGAKITAKYVRYAMNDAVFDSGSINKNGYILDGTKVAADSEIKIQENNPSTSYTKPVSENYITANEVLTLPGFYIFTLIDDAGNEATLKIVLDNSLPTILQANEPEIVGQEPSYEIISGLNTIAGKTRVFFGTHKLVKLNIENSAYDPSNDTRFVNIDGTYYMQTTLNANVKERSNKTSKNSISNANQGYDIIELETRDGKVIECTYKYTITDETRKETSYLVTISTDKTGVNVITNDDTQFVNEGTKTTNAIYNNNEEETSSSKRITYYNFVDSDVVYLIYKTLTPDGINAKIDLTQNGLTIEYYALVYNSTKGCYEYSDSPSQTIVITEEIANNTDYRGIIGKETVFKYPINVDSLGKTLPGKYVVKRNYTIDDAVGETRTISQIVENDFVLREYVFFVDRNPIISAPTSSVSEQRYGAYSYITLFDGQNKEIKYEGLYNQNQNNLRAVLLTNKLPIGVYIPTNKYGYVSDETFKNTVLFENLDADVNGNPTNFYPYVLTVYVTAPNGQKYEYKKAAEANYYVLENNSAIISNSEWVGGDYTLTITCGTTTKQNATDVPTQTFNFVYKVSDLAPEINIQGQYVGLNMIYSQQLVEEKDVYYSNADIINVSFQDPSTEYLTKIGKISYRFASGAWQDLDISSKNISINVKELAPNATQLQIKVEYEVYCEEGNEDLQALYPNGHWQVIKTIKFYKTAPVQVLTALKNADLIVNNISFDAFREIGERYNLTTAEGVYKQYSFAIKKADLNSILAPANELYFKKVEDKYPNAVEIQSPFKAGVAAGNVFNKELATTTLGYSKYVANNTEFDINDYYEFVEYDQYGNTSIYTVFVLPSDDSITLKTSAGEFSPTETEILSRRNFYFESIGAKNTLNQINNAKYQYIKVSMNGQTYLLTPFTGAANAYNITVQSETPEQVELKDVVLNPGRYTISLIENNTQHNIVLRIGANDEKLRFSYFNENGEVGIIVGESPVIELKSLTITVINSNGTTDPYEYIKGEESNTITNVDNKYYISRNGKVWDNSIFLIQITDNFGEKYSILKSYTQTQFNRYETAEQKSDITQEMQTSSNILVSHNVLFNFSNLYKAKVEKRSFNATQFVNANLGDPEVKTGYYQFELTKSNAQNDLFDGGVIFYKITLSANIPNQNEIDVDIEDEEFYITIFNQLPKLTIRDSSGVDITNELYEKTKTQSDEVYLNFETENEISQSLGCTSKVYLRLRGASEGYVEIPNEYVVSEPGTYDVLIQNECDGKVFANSETHSFIISNHDVMFYSVINTETDEIVNPTGTSYDFDGEIINYYYILNTDSYTIATNNGATYVQDGVDSNGAIVTKIYKISAGTNFSRNIAITVIPKNNNIISDFGYFVGDNSGVVGIQNINTPELDVYLYKTNTEDSITLRWNYYYGIEANVIIYEITRGSGSDAVTIKGESYNKSSGFMEYTLDKSGIYTIKFKDLAGNVQVLTTNKGIFDSYKINFIKSVIFEINDELPIDNAIYNEPVTISVPASTKSYYQTNPTIVATKNGKEVLLTQNKDGKYVATEQGEYVVYFTASKNNVELKEEPIRFAIINANESRWAFNYHNYNGYQIEAKYNNEEFDLSNVLDGGEIVMSVILGNDSLDNGIYSFKMTTEEGLNFAFNIWLNNTKPDILVSHEEGTKTTEHIIVRYNTENLFDSVGDCIVKINNKVVSTINSEYFETENYDKTVLVELTEVSPYLIQVYTANDKLIYSYKVEITAPLNAISIILISVGAGVAVTGIILFILLRKKLKIR